VAGRVVMAAVVCFQGGGRLRRGGEEEAAPIECGERRRRPRDIRSYAEEVAGGTRQRGRPSGGVRVLGAGGRRRPGSLTGWAHRSVMGRRWADWAKKGGRRWAAAGLEKKGGGRAETIARAKI
jgi:hypothetical protein